MYGAWLRRALAPVTWPASWLFGSGVLLRNTLYRSGTFRIHRLTYPVISIGNLTIGGSGKTPLVATIARYFLARGQRVAVLSRGYRRRGGGSFLLVSDGRNIDVDAGEAGDEPVELAKSVEGLVVAVGANRCQVGLEVIRKTQPRIFLLDDGFQHRRLFRNLDLVCVDSEERVENLKLLPAGRLREPLSEVNRAGALIWTRWKRGAPSDRLVSRVLGALGPEIPVFRAVQKIIGFSRLAAAESPLGPDALQGQPVGMLAAIAKPGRFAETLEVAGARTVWSGTRRDHHMWRPEELARAAEKAKDRGAMALVTTGKDAVKLEGLDGVDGLALPLYRMNVKTEVVEQESFASLLDSVLPPD